jgi:riboflavin transporter FmnP
MPKTLPSTGRKRRPVRLWPFMFLPILGFVAGVYFRYVPRFLPFIQGDVDPVTGAAFGLLTGSCAMILCAFIVLAYRVAGSRFTIGSIMATIAVVAVLMGLARALLS